METESSIARNLENRAIKWYGHVERMLDETSHQGKNEEEKDLKDGDWMDRRLWKLKTTNP